MTVQAGAADPDAREFLKKADPVLARLIAAHPDFHPRAWIEKLPQMDAFGTAHGFLIFALDRPDVMLSGLAVSYLFASELPQAT